MDSEDNIEKQDKKEKKQKPEIKEVGGMRGWLLRKAKTFMWVANSNTLVLPKGVVLTVEEKADLQAIFGQIVDDAQIVAKHREQMMELQQQSGVKFKSEVIKGYNLLVNGTYRELTGVLAHKIHDNLQGMLMVNNRFLSGLWKALNRSNDNKKAQENIAMMKKQNER